MDTKTAPEFRMGTREWNARGTLTGEGFIVYKGSTVNHVTECFRKNKTYFPLRDELERTDVIVYGTFVRDYVFATATQAGSVIASRPISVSREWVTEDGRNFGEVYPKMRGERRAKAAKAANCTAVRPDGTSGFMYDGTPFLVTSNDEFVTEWRGQVHSYMRQTAN